MSVNREDGIVCERCHRQADSAGQLVDSSEPIEPMDGEICSQCNRLLYYPSYLDVIEP